MGTDIHQLNVLFDQHGKPLGVEGETIGERVMIDGHAFDVKPFKAIDELVPYRYYDVFGVLAGVRADYMTLNRVFHTVSNSGSDRYEKLMNEMCLNMSAYPDGECPFYMNDAHSHVWYHPTELEKGLDFTISKIDVLIEASPFKKFNVIFDMIRDVDDLSDLKNELSKVRERLTESKYELKKAGASFDNSVIMFYFDS